MALFSYCVGNQLILGQSGSDDRKNVYHMFSVLKTIKNINHFALPKSLLEKEMLNLNFEWIVKASTTRCVQLPETEGNGK